MRKQNIVFFLVIIFIGIVSVFFEGQHSITIKGDTQCTSIDSTLFRKLATMVNENRFNRQYYEVIYHNYNKGCHSYVLNYNTKYGLLSISTDPCSGWDTYVKVSKEELLKIANNNVKIGNIYQLYGSRYQTKNFPILPTKACSFSFF